jgi:hypothetical protein
MQDWFGGSLRGVGAIVRGEVGNEWVVGGQEGRTTPEEGEGHRMMKIGIVVSWDGSGEKGRRTELELGSGKSLDDHHGAAAFGT